MPTKPRASSGFAVFCRRGACICEAGQCWRLGVWSASILNHPQSAIRHPLPSFVPRNCPRVAAGTESGLFLRQATPMSEPKDPKAPQRSDQPTAVGTQGGDKRSGRVSHDSRGNPVWEWQLETGVYTRDVNTQKLRKLDLGDLSLAETASHKKLPDDGAQDPR